jgi:hypothetical protein
MAPPSDIAFSSSVKAAQERRGSRAASPGGTSKYKGITGSEPFACDSLPKLAGDGSYTSMDIPHNTTWEIKGQ